MILELSCGVDSKKSYTFLTLLLRAFGVLVDCFLAGDFLLGGDLIHTDFLGVSFVTALLQLISERVEDLLLRLFSALP